MSPLVSVIIPVFNAQLYIGECIESIVRQSYQELEILVVDDGCTDDSIAIVRSFRDRRIKILHNERNVGLAGSINRAVNQAQGSFLARMDADDIALPERISKQVSFLNRNEKISILGSAMKSFGKSSYVHRFPVKHDGCKAQLLFNVCFGHPTVMFRREVFDYPGSFYREELEQYSEEYELWCRLVDNFEFANLPDVLLRYRTLQENVKADAETKRRRNSYCIRKDFLTNQLGFTTDDELSIHDDICNLKKAVDKAEFRVRMEWLREIEEKNKMTSAFSTQALHKELLKRTFELHYSNTQFGISLWMDFIKRADSLPDPGLYRHAKYLFKSLLSK